MVAAKAATHRKLSAQLAYTVVQHHTPSYKTVPPITRKAMCAWVEEGENHMRAHLGTKVWSHCCAMSDTHKLRLRLGLGTHPYTTHGVSYHLR